MSDYGIIVRNSKRAIIIDSKFKNFSYYQSGTSSLNSGYNIISINNTTDDLILVIQPSEDAFIANYGFVRSDITNEYESIRLLTDGACTCNWILYKSGESIATGDYGLLIRNEDNDICFNSNELGYFNIVRKHSPRIYQDDYSKNYFIVNDINNYFQLLGTKYRTTISGGIYTNYISGIKKIDSNTIDVTYTIPVETGSSSGTSTYSTSINTYLLEIKPPPSI